MGGEGGGLLTPPSSLHSSLSTRPLHPSSLPPFRPLVLKWHHFPLLFLTGDNGSRSFRLPVRSPLYRWLAGLGMGNVTGKAGKL